MKRFVIPVQLKAIALGLMVVASCLAGGAHDSAMTRLISSFAKERPVSEGDLMSYIDMASVKKLNESDNVEFFSATISEAMGGGRINWSVSRHASKLGEIKGLSLILPQGEHWRCEPFKELVERFGFAVEVFEPRSPSSGFHYTEPASLETRSHRLALSTTDVALPCVSSLSIVEKK